MATMIARATWLQPRGIIISQQRRPKSILWRTNIQNGKLKTSSSNTKRQLYLMHHFSTCAGTTSVWMMDPTSNQQSLLKKDTNDASSTTMIACSTNGIRINSPKNILLRWINFIRLWWQNTWKMILVASRTADVTIRLSPLLILSPATVLSGSPTVSNLTWRYTISAIQGIGPVAVKFAQWIATRRDIFPPTFCDRLSVLHDHGYPHSWYHTKRTLTDAFGDYRSKGLEIHKEDAIGCGSAAQVYRGTLTTKDEESGRDSKQIVAIKVLHPKFQRQVVSDLKLLQTLADFLHCLPTNYIRMLNLPRATDTFGSVLCQQADLTIEANNLRHFRSNFYQNSKSREDKSSITFPKPIDGWSSSNVIVEEYHDAQPISNFLKDSSPQGIAVRKELAGPLLRAFLKMLFIDNFVHGDLHPGNVLIKTTTIPNKEDVANDWWTFSTWGGNSANNNDPSSQQEIVKRTIVFLDAGIATSLSPEDQRNLRDLFKAIIFNEGNQAGRLMVERAKYEQCEDIDAFARGVEEIVAEFHDRRKEGLTLGAVRVGGLLSRVLDLCRIHRVEIDPAMASIGK